MKSFILLFALLFAVHLHAEESDTLVFLKPDAYEKHIWGPVLSEFEKKGIKIVALQMTKLTKEQAESFYAMHKGKKFFADLVSYVSRAPILAVVLRTDNAIAKVRAILGATNPRDAGKDTIRGKYGQSLDANVIHGSDSPEAAKREISFFFPQKDILG